jgi:hypothetical protein
MNADDHIRVVLWMPCALYGALKRAADDAREPMPDALRARLAASLTVPHAANRAGVAGDGEARAASPKLT